MLKENKMKKENMINCPDCGAQLDIDEVLFDQMKAKAKKSLEVKHSKNIEELEAKHRKLDSEKLNLERDRKNIEETLQAVYKLNIPTIWFWPNIDAGTDETSKGIRTFREIHKPKKIRFIKYLPPSLVKISYILCYLQK